MAKMQHASNTNNQTMSDNMSDITTRLESMNSTIQAQQQQIYNMAHAPTVTSSAWTAPTSVAGPPTNIYLAPNQKPYALPTRSKL